MVNIVKEVLKVFSENHLWDDGIELIGSWCFILYQKHFGVKYYPLRTQDMDFLISFPYKGKHKLDLINALEDIGFRKGFNPNGSIYLWNSELKIEFIVPQRGKGIDDTIKIKDLSVVAETLRYMDILLDHPVIINEEGIEINIPEPSAFFIHKLLIVKNRKNKEKKLKDLEQIMCLIETVKKEDIKKIFNTLPKGWQRDIILSLEESKRLFPNKKSLIDDIVITLQNLKNNKK